MGRLGLVLLALVVCLASSDALARGRKKKKKKSRKRAAVERVYSGPNFMLEDWLWDVRGSLRSASTGKANRGRVEHSVRLPLRGRTWRFLASVRKRGTNYGHERLAELVVRAADAVAEKHRGSILDIGNMGLVRGGRITQSKSHQGGRDVDVAIFAVDKKGRRINTGRFIKFNAECKAARGLEVDRARNWELVKALVMSEDPVVQWLFIATPVEKALLQYAREQKEEGWIVRRAAAIMHQPGDSAAHADHFHIRIFCSDWDRAQGCVDYGPERSRHVRDDSIKTRRVETLERRISRGLDSQRLAALETLFVLAPDRAGGLARKLLCDPSKKMVERALAEVKHSTTQGWEKLVAGALHCAAEPATELVLLEAVGKYLDKRVRKAARKAAARPYCLDGAKCSGSDCKAALRLCVVAVEALAWSTELSDGKVLAGLVESKEKRVRRKAVRALRTLFATNDPVVAGKKVDEKKTGEKKSRAERWQRLVRKSRKLSWEKQAFRQFQRQGYALHSRLTRKANTALLLKALKTGFPLGFASQRALASIFKQDFQRPLGNRAAYRLYARLAANSGRAGPAAQPTSPGRQALRKLPPLPEM